MSLDKSTVVHFSDDQFLVIQRSRAQVVDAERKLTEMELECQISEMTVGAVGAPNNNLREAIEIKTIVLQMLRADLAARENIFARSIERRT